MKKIVVLYFMIFCQFLFGVEKTGLSSLKTIKLYAKEMIVINKEKKYGEYELSIAFPDKMKKIQTSPEMNKGEIYIYIKGEKTTYLPFFNQTNREKVKADENTIMNYLNSILELEKKDKIFRNDYIKKRTVSLVNESGEKIVLKEIKEFNKILFPTYIEIYNKEEIVAEIKLEKIEINPKFGEEEFELKSK